MAADKIGADVVVSIAYVLTVEGREIERADASDPIEYLHGHANIVPGLEAALDGHQVGDKFTVTVPPDKGYGQYDQDDIERIARSEIPNVDQLKTGMVVEMEDEEGYIYEATVKEINKDAVVLDFNPPLAGKTLNFEVEVIGLREANEDELDHGHPHGIDFDDDWDEDDYDDEDYDEDFDEEDEE
jgi:FKBP-type peptidyl-prolyl cis-trans isomerase SlyD